VAEAEAKAAGGGGGGAVDRSLHDWRALINDNFTQRGFLVRRQAEGEGLDEANDELSAPQGSKTDGAGDRKWCYRLGPRARHAVGAPALLGVIERLAGAAYGAAEVAANLGVEWAGVDAAAQHRDVAKFFESKEDDIKEANIKKLAAFAEPPAAAGRKKKEK
jgi:hypothetical protein